MRLCIVGDLVTHAGPEDELPPIRKLRVQFAFEAKQDVTFRAPVICDIARRVLHHSDANPAELTRSPVRDAMFPFMFGRHDLGPVGYSEGQFTDVHVGYLLLGPNAGV